MTVPAGAPGDEVPHGGLGRAGGRGRTARRRPPAHAPPQRWTPDAREADEADLVEQEQPVDLSDEEQ